MSFQLEELSFTVTQMDYVDAPYMTMKQRQQKPANSFQNELREKMRQRKSLGLTTDVTSEESEGVDDGHDSEEENSKFDTITN